jgi:GNAT superfamily N-acetyltransferase
MIHPHLPARIAPVSADPSNPIEFHPVNDPPTRDAARRLIVKYLDWIATNAVQPHVRGVGAGRRLLAQLLADAHTIGHERVRLESLRFCTDAHALYRSAGFVELPPYAEYSMSAYQPAEMLERYRASTVFMELRLGGDKLDG